MDKHVMGLVLVVVGVIGLLAAPMYAGWAWNTARVYSSGSSWNSGMMGQWSKQPQTPTTTPITLDEAHAIAQQYLASTQNLNLGIKEIMEFQNNFYIVYYEKDTGIGAFEMLIWKQAPSSGIMGDDSRTGRAMMGYGMMTGTIMPEPGPNMMWNTKYDVMKGMMGPRGRTVTSSQMQVSEQEASSIAETYLSQNFPGSHVEGIAQFYGYYTIDFQKDSKIAGMLSLNGYSGQVWYHSWHDAFIQEIELD